MNLYPARLDKFPPGTGLGSWKNGSAHFGVKFSYKMRGGKQQRLRNLRMRLEVEVV